MLLQEASGEATGLQRQLGEQRAAGQQAGQGLGHTVAQRVHAEVELLQALRGKQQTAACRRDNSIFNYLRQGGYVFGSVGLSAR